MPRPLVERLARRGLADLAEIDDGVLRLDPRVCGLPAGAPIPCPPEMLDVGARLDALQAAGLGAAAVSAPPFLFASAAEDGFAHDLVKAANDALAEWVADGGDRLCGLGTAPVSRPGVAAEARRCREELGFPGLTIGSSGGGRELDDPSNDELWELIAAQRIFTLLHPSAVSSPSRLRDFHLVQLLGYPAETALAVARLAFSGVLERWELPLCLAHGGGSSVAIWGRLDLGWRRKAVCQAIAAPPSALLRRLLYDTAVFDPRQLRRLVEDVGAGNVLLGTDTPFDLADRDPLRSLAAAGLSEAERTTIVETNPRRLLFGDSC